jgi:hypothetical protein
MFIIYILTLLQHQNTPCLPLLAQLVLLLVNSLHLMLPEVLCPCNLIWNLMQAIFFHLWFDVLSEVLVVSLAQILHYISFIFESMSYLVYVSPKLAKDNLTWKWASRCMVASDKLSEQGCRSVSRSTEHRHVMIGVHPNPRVDSWDTAGAMLLLHDMNMNMNLLSVWYCWSCDGCFLYDMNMNLLSVSFLYIYLISCIHVLMFIYCLILLI